MTSQANTKNMSDYQTTNKVGQIEDELKLVRDTEKKQRAEYFRQKENKQNTVNVLNDIYPTKTKENLEFVEARIKEIKAEWKTTEKKKEKLKTILNNIKQKPKEQKPKEQKPKEQKPKEQKPKESTDKDKKELLKISKQKSLKYFQEHLLDKIEKITNKTFTKDERKTSNMTTISQSKPYKKLVKKFKNKRVKTDDDVSEGMKSTPELYSGVCGLSNQCAFTDMTFLMCAIVEGWELKWDQPHKAKRPVQEGDLMTFAFGIGHPLAGETIILEVDSVLGVDQRESHWSDTGYTEHNSNSRERWCVLFKRNFAFGRWTASGIKTKQGFTIVNENRQEWEILIDGEYRTL